MSRFDLVQVGFFKPILESLHQAGVSMDPLIRKAGLEKFNLHLEDGYVPVSFLYKLLETVQHEQGVEDFFNEFYEVCHLVSLSQWGQMISLAPDVWSACRLAEQHDLVALTHESIGLEVNGATAKLWQSFEDEPVAGWEAANYLSLALMLNGFRLAGGPDWAPLEIHFQAKTPLKKDTFLPPGYQTKLYFGQPVSAVVFPTSMFNKPMLGNASGIDLELKEGPKTTSLKTICLLESMAGLHLPNIEVMSELAGMSTRSYQRRLAVEGTTYQDLVDGWRFKSALQFLAKGTVPIKEISQNLYYANTPNFHRAFRRWTNTSPQEYRQELAKAG
ncbi:MAG: AraC family transcriptional regulator [Cyclobacteriaceae bacterium]|nr:AraC family transcriptional regulator [Cyclobacteriaceae bacterium]